MIETFLLSVFLASRAVANEPRILPKDALVIHAAGIPQDDAEVINHDNYRVDEAGHVSLPNLGRVIVGGFTATEAARLIEEDYISYGYYTHPSVTINIRIPNSLVAEVWVGGSVQHSGKYRLKKPATIEQALAAAGGWGGAGELGIPARGCSLTHEVNGEIVINNVRVHIDRRTKQIEVLNQAWKEYQLADGDKIVLAIVTL